MAEQFDTLHDVRERLNQITVELNSERRTGWPNGPKDFHMRRLQVFCELLYTDLLARTSPEFVREAEEAVRIREQDDIGKSEPPYTPPSPKPTYYEPVLNRERDLVSELEAMAKKR